MSIEKVKRYDLQVARLKHDCGESFVANMVDVAEGRYIEYADVAGLIKNLNRLLSRVDSNQCRHESTHRGGAIWTICDDCGEKFADDRGGFKPYIEPDDVRQARNELARWQS